VDRAEGDRMSGAAFARIVSVVVVTSILAQAGLYVAAAIDLRHRRQRDRHLRRHALTSDLSPRISVLVPAYNEGVSIVESVTGLLALQYPNLEVVVINDGSSDDSLDQLIAAFRLSPVHSIYQQVIDTQPVRELYRSAIDPRLVVADKHNGGKADSLNVGINLASGELVCAIDADTMVDPTALQVLVAPFLETDETVAVGGTIRLINDAESRNHRVDRLHAPKGWLVGAQVVEYSRAFLIGRLGWNLLGGNLIISGAFGLFRRSRVLETGGYESDSIGEDMELVVRLRRCAYEEGRRARVVFEPDPVAYTEAPTSLVMLARQRNRWFRGLLDVLVRHRRMMLNPRYGSAGVLALPYFLVVEALAPILEMLGLGILAVGLVSGWITVDDLPVVIGAYLLGACATVGVLLLDQLVWVSYRSTRERIRILAYVVFEQALFRPATIVWRLWGLKLFLEGRTEWGVQHRQGFTGNS
jgi:cellulose synthase/poly-beta-1,6-N-acetylglucosamine synthase-like glycosyltransferase